MGIRFVRATWTVFCTQILTNGSFVPGDQAALIQIYGGPEEFVRRLDFLHDQNITYIGNEVSRMSLNPMLKEVLTAS